MKEKRILTTCGVFKLRKLSSGEKRWKVSFFNKVTNEVIHAHFEKFQEAVDWIRSMRYDYSSLMIDKLNSELDEGFKFAESEKDFL